MNPRCTYIHQDTNLYIHIHMCKYIIYMCVYKVLEVELWTEKKKHNLKVENYVLFDR